MYCCYKSPHEQDDIIWRKNKHLSENLNSISSGDILSNIMIFKIWIMSEPVPAIVTSYTVSPPTDIPHSRTNHSRLFVVFYLYIVCAVCELYNIIICRLHNVVSHGRRAGWANNMNLTRPPWNRPLPYVVSWTPIRGKLILYSVVSFPHN